MRGQDADDVAEDARLDEEMGWYPENLDMRDPDGETPSPPLCPRCYWRPPLLGDWCALNDGSPSHCPQCAVDTDAHNHDAHVDGQADG